MTLLEPLVGQALTNLIYNHIQSHIQKVCKDSFDTSSISSLEKVCGYINMIFTIVQMHGDIEEKIIGI